MEIETKKKQKPEHKPDQKSDHKSKHKHPATETVANLAQSAELAVEDMDDVSVAETEDEDILEEPAPVCVTPDADYSDTILVIGTTRLGKGRKKQGRTLMRSFLYALSQMTKLPRTIVLLNSGVKLALRSSHSLDDLIDLEARGTKVLVCSSSLETYDAKDKLAVGKVTTMYHITELLISGGPIVTL